MNYPVALGNKSNKLLYTSSEVLLLTVAVDRSGEVREVIEGIMLPEEFEQKIKPLLGIRLIRLIKIWGIAYIFATSHQQL